jgi:hypothetical protein
MAGLVPAIYVLSWRKQKGVDGRDKPGHDGENAGHSLVNGDIISPC